MNPAGHLALHLNPNLTSAERLEILSRYLDHEESMYRRFTAHLADFRQGLGPVAAAELADSYVRMCHSLGEMNLALYCLGAQHFFQMDCGKEVTRWTR